MKFEIKSRWDGSVRFSLETENLKLCVEAAVKAGAYLAGAYLTGANLAGANLAGADLRGAYLAGADLAGADLRGANLTGADLRGANLTGADLAGADLTGADLAGADLRGADLRGANLAGADLTGARGINKNLVTPLRILLEQPGPIWAYKLVNAEGQGPFNGGINYLDPNVDEFSVIKANADENEQCGAGINLATLDWVMKEWKPGYRILIMEFFANKPEGNLIVPTATDGKFRVKECRRVGEKSLTEIGLVKETTK